MRFFLGFYATCKIYFMFCFEGLVQCLHSSLCKRYTSLDLLAIRARTKNNIPDFKLGALSKASATRKAPLHRRLCTTFILIPHSYLHSSLRSVRFAATLWSLRGCYAVLFYLLSFIFPLLRHIHTHQLSVIVVFGF